MPFEQPLPLFSFAFIPVFGERLRDLAELAESEDWEYATTPSDHPYPVLFNYLHYTFRRLLEEEKITFTDDGQYACANTGLATDSQEDIYMLFKKNTMPDRQPWYFLRFCRRGEHDLTRFQPLPEPANYFEDPSCLVLDNRMEIRPNVEHIIQENKERFPEPYRTMPAHSLGHVLTGAIEHARDRARRNYKVAVPQYYRGKVQLLLPLCLSDAKTADLALVLERHPGCYRAATCLTLDMAYNNARQLAKPDRDWLAP